MNTSNRSQELYLETQMGLITRYGDWFHTTAKHIENFVPGLLEKRSLDELVEEANAWVRSADSLAMTILLILLLFIHPILAAAIAVAFHFFWYRTKSAFVTIYMGKLLKMLNTDGYLLVSSLIIISALGMGGHYLAAGLALLFFFVMKLGLLKRLWDKIDEGVEKDLTLNDRVFKMILIKYGLHYNITPAEVQKMESTFQELAMSRKARDSE